MYQNSDDLFTRFDRIHERDRETDRQTRGQTDKRTLHLCIGRAYAQHLVAICMGIAIEVCHCHSPQCRLIEGYAIAKDID